MCSSVMRIHSNTVYASAGVTLYVHLWSAAAYLLADADRAEKTLPDPYCRRDMKIALVWMEKEKGMEKEKPIMVLRTMEMRWLMREVVSWLATTIWEGTAEARWISARVEDILTCLEMEEVRRWWLGNCCESKTKGSAASLTQKIETYHITT